MTNNMETSGGMANGTQVSQPDASGTATAPSAVDINSALERLEKRLEQIERGSQSVKDKRIAGLQGDMDTFKNQLSELRELMQGGMSEAAALRLMSLQAQPASQPPPVTGTHAQEGSDIDVSSVMSAMNLDANDPEVLAALRNERNPVNLVARLTRIAAGKKVPTQPIPTAQSMAAPAAPASTRTIDNVAAELEGLMREPSKNMAKIRELRKELAAMNS